MKKNIGKAILIVGILILIIGIIFVVQEKFASSPKIPNQPVDEGNPINPGDKDQIGGDIEDVQTEEKTEEELNKLVDALFNDDTTKDYLSELTGVTVDNYYIFYGKDSYIRTLGSNISGLDQYKKRQKEYATTLEEKIKDNFNFEIKDYIISADGAIVQRLEYQTYYYNYFVQDYSYLTSELMKYTDVDLEAVEERNLTNEEKEKIYKIQIKALEIISNYFDNYQNDNEIKEYEIIYRKEATGIVNEYFSLFMNFNGCFYNNAQLNETNREQRVKSYISEAISSGQLDTSNPYKLK